MKYFMLILAATIGITTANTCVDLWRNTCTYYKNRCSYDTNVRRNCARTCNLCSQGCQDQLPSQCKSWKPYCSQPHIKSYCKKTCGECGPTTQGPPTQRPPSPGPPGKCGQPAIAGSRVIAGKTAVKGSWPWQILMSFNGRPSCGGSLVSPYWVVTAAHCVKGKEHFASSFSVTFGAHDRNSPSGNEETIRVSRVISHPTFGSRGQRNMDYDIALFKLSRPPKMGRYVSTVCLPQASKPVPVGTECYITGWGKIQHPGRMHYILQQAKMNVVSNNVCHRLNYRTTSIPVTQTMVCAGNGGRTRVSGCHGDSGGPFVCKTGPNGAWELHGAVSWGSTSCSSSLSYTVFARITALRGWIDQQMRRY